MKNKISILAMLLLSNLTALYAQSQPTKCYTESELRSIAYKLASGEHCAAQYNVCQDQLAILDSIVTNLEYALEIQEDIVQLQDGVITQQKSIILIQSTDIERLQKQYKRKQTMNIAIYSTAGAAILALIVGILVK